MYRCEQGKTESVTLNTYEQERLAAIQKTVGPRKPLLATGLEIVWIDGVPISKRPRIDPAKFAAPLLGDGFAVWTRGVEPDSNPVRETESCDRLVVADESALQAVLDRGRDVLASNHWPGDVEGFVRQVFIELAPARTPLYDLVADAYGDPHNPGRTNVAVRPDCVV